MKTYVLQVGLEHQDDGRLSVWIDAPPGYAAWGYTRDEALQAIKDAADIYVEEMIEAGEEIPKEGVQVIDASAITVTLI